MRTLNADELNDLLGSLAQPGALTELAVLAGCLALAWCIVRLIRDRKSTRLNSSHRP